MDNDKVTLREALESGLLNGRGEETQPQEAQPQETQSQETQPREREQGQAPEQGQSMAEEAPASDQARGDSSLAAGEQGQTLANPAQSPASTGNVAEGAVSAGNVAADAVAADAVAADGREMWAMVNALMQDNQQLRAALQQQTAAGNQQSALAENALAGQFTPQAAIPTTPAPVEDVPPQTLNFEELQYMSDDERNKRVLEWQTDVMRYAADQAVRRVREELAPVREDYETKRRMAAEEAAKSVVFADPRFSGLKGEMNEIERIIQSTPMLANAGDPEMKYTLAALLRNGVKYSRQPTSEEIIALVDKNPEVQKALEGRRARAVRDNTGSLPKPQPSSGLSSAAAVPENRPKSYQDVAKKFSQAFGLAR